MYHVKLLECSLMLNGHYMDLRLFLNKVIRKKIKRQFLDLLKEHLVEQYNFPWFDTYFKRKGMPKIFTRKGRGRYEFFLFDPWISK